MANRFEMSSQNHFLAQEIKGVEPKVVEHIKEDLRDLFRSA